MKSLPNLEISKCCPEGTGTLCLRFFPFCRFFTYGEDTREARRLRQAELRAHGKRMAEIRKTKVDANNDNSSVNSE